MPELGDILGGISRGQDDLARQFTPLPAVANFLQFFNEDIVTLYSGTIIQIRGIGSSFVVGDGSYAILGTTTPQPYLGDSRPGFTTALNQYTGSPFLNSGLTQLRDFILGSSSAIAPTLLVAGSGTFIWNGSIQALSGLSQNLTATRTGEGVQYGSFFATVPSVNLTGSATIPRIGGSFSEIAISGGALFTYDSFTTQVIGPIGSEIRFVSVFRVGS